MISLENGTSTYSRPYRLTGVIPIQNYQVIIYQRLGFSNLLSLVLTGVYGTIATASAIMAMFFCDRIGRRKLVVSWPSTYHLRSSETGPSCFNDVLPQFVAYAIMISASLILVVLWARYEASGSTSRGLGIGVVFSIYYFSCGYSGPMNTFWPTVCLLSVHPAHSTS